jgi:Amt family ammonium transporter
MLNAKPIRFRTPESRTVSDLLSEFDFCFLYIPINSVMAFLTFLRGGKGLPAWLALGLILFGATLLRAQPETNAGVPGPGEISAESALPSTNAPATNAPPAPAAAVSLPDAAPAPTAAPATKTIAGNDMSYASYGWTTIGSPSILGALMTLASLAGFVLYYCGLTRAKNSGHSAMLLLVGVLFALTGYWIGGFAVQNGGIGDAHAALAQALPPTESSSLDHELGTMALGHHWGLMGSSGFFLATDDPVRNGIAALFLMQAALLAIAVASALGAALERGRLLAMSICAFLIGVLIYPFFANWVWGGGWLAELGREFGLGHGFVDLGGAGVVHETAGALALVIAIVLGPRYGRFDRGKNNLIPGHNVPFIVLGSIVLLVSWMATNGFASENLPPEPTASSADSLAGAVSASIADSTDGLAAINTLLAATGGLIISFLLAAWRKQAFGPTLLCRGLLAGAVASCGGAALIDPWAAFLIGGAAGVLVQAAVNFLERRGIDDPAGAVAVHGVSGAWGVLAVGLFANGTAGHGYNGVSTSGGIRGLFFGGAWHQLAAQAIGCVACLVVVYILGYLCVTLVHKILGLRVDLKNERTGLDLSEVGALGYQGDVEPEEESSQ